MNLPHPCPTVTKRQRWLPVVLLLLVIVLTLAGTFNSWRSLNQVEHTLCLPNLHHASLLSSMEDDLDRILEILQRPMAEQDESVLVLSVRKAHRTAKRMAPALGQPMVGQLETLIQILGKKGPDPQAQNRQARDLVLELHETVHASRHLDHEHSRHLMTSILEEDQRLRLHLLWGTTGIALLTLMALFILASRWKLESTLQESQRSLTTLLENLPGMVYRCRNDPQWTMLFVSEGCEALTGHPAEDLLEHGSLSFSDLVDARDQTRIWQDVQEALARNQPFQLTYRMRCADGSEKWVWEQGRRVPCDMPGEEHLEGFISDITTLVQTQEALKQAKAQVEDAHRARGDALLLLSHEIRTPLAGLNASLDLLTRTMPAREPNHYLAMAHDTANALTAVVEDLLDMAMGERHSRTTQRLFQVQAILKQVVSHASRHLQETDVTLRLEVDPAIPQWLRGNVPSLRQLLLHLLLDAIHHTETGEILLQATLQEGRQEVSSLAVTLTVPGATPLPSVEDPGCQRYLQALQGHGQVIREGSVQRLVLTLALENALPTVPVFSRSQPLAIPALNLMLAEDDPILQEVISEILELQGHQVTIVGNGREVLDEIERNRYDLLLLDLRMPFLNGFQTAQALREHQNPHIAGLPIVALTADLSEESLRQSFASGINAVEGKPLQLDSLTDTMIRVLSSHQGQVTLLTTLPATTPPRELSEETFLRLHGSLGHQRFLEVAQLMQDNAADLLARLASALDQEDLRTGREVAHRLAGVSGSLGLEKLAACARELEAALARQELQQALQLLPAVREEARQGLDQLARRLADPLIPPSHP